MSSAAENPFDTSYEEYVEAFGPAQQHTVVDPFDVVNDDAPDDPDVTAASAGPDVPLPVAPWANTEPNGPDPFGGTA